jgi:hypothetical protein
MFPYAYNAPSTAWKPDYVPKALDGHIVGTSHVEPTMVGSKRKLPLDHDLSQTSDMCKPPRFWKNATVSVPHTSPFIYLLTHDDVFCFKRRETQFRFKKFSGTTMSWVQMAT